MNIDKIGLSISFLISGLFGAILMASKSAKGNIKSVIISIVGGMASANYLTPVMIEMLNLKETKLQNGLAFVIGFLGLRLVEIVSEKFLNKIIAVDEPKTTKHKTQLTRKKPVIKKTKKNVRNIKK
jgi:uncharacterized membrane protein YeaQ/YmgE (transglycosylase-associated protein family)